MKKLIMCSLAILLSLPIFSQKAPKGTSTGPSTPVAKVKNVILLIGDGMGLTQLSAGMYFNNNQSQFERFPIAGLQKPSAANELITDSAAGATALATGVKTYNGGISVDLDSTQLKTILEEAERKGMATGMVVTSTITDATPAAFVAHVRNRRKEEEIATWFLKSEIDFFVGGGKRYFDQRTTDTRNLYQELKDKGFQVSDYTQTGTITPDPQKKFAYFSAELDPLKVSEGRDYLAPMSILAIQQLKQQSDKGFFLMVEGSQIDWGGHSNNSDYIVSEMVDFDKTVGKVLDFAAADGETLVIVTADHETGGYAINPGSEFGSIKGAFTTTNHTAQLVPVFAFGPGADLFAGVYENTAIFAKMKQVLGF